MQSKARAQLFITFISSVSAVGPLGFHTASLCPYDASGLATYTSNKIKGTSTSVTWAGIPLTAAQDCPSIRFTPKAQGIAVTSFDNYQTNIDRWVPRSHTYALSVLRPFFVSSAHLDFDIVDAHGITIVPRMAVTLGAPSSASSQLTTLSTGSRRSQQFIAKTKGKGYTQPTHKRAESDDTISTQVHRALSLHKPFMGRNKRLPTGLAVVSMSKGTHGDIQPKHRSADSGSAIITQGEQTGNRLPLHKPFLGRRKGKGIGGGGRYGGGSGGFRTSRSVRTYGYSSSALGKRFAPGYSRTPYGYSGRSLIYVGAWMHLYPRGPGHAYQQSCERYTGNSKSRCQQSFNTTLCDLSTMSPAACTPLQHDGVVVKNQYTLIRDDLMAATVNTKSNITLPLTINIFKAAVVFQDTANPDPWAQPLLFSFSEVDFDDENDPVLTLGVFIVLVSLGSIFVVCICICIWCWCSECLVVRSCHDVQPDLESQAESMPAQKRAHIRLAELT